MHVLLLRPVPVNERFGLGPFFRIEPLGMAYIAAALERQGHTATIADLRFSRSVEHYLRTERPGLVGIAGMHALETDNVIELAARVRRASPDVPILIGGHTASAYPAPFLTCDVTAVVVDDGERAVPQVVAALERRQPLAAVPGLVMRDDTGVVTRTAGPLGTLTLTKCRGRRGAWWIPGAASTRAWRIGPCG